MANLLSTQEINDSSKDGDTSWNFSDISQERSPYKIPSQNWMQINSGDSEKKFVCNRCGKTYKATTSLSRHIRLECGVLGTEVCPLCNRRFKHKFVLNSHILACQRRYHNTVRKDNS